MRFRGLLLVALVAAAGGCDDNPAEPVTGTLQVQVTTSGDGTDEDGFVVDVDDGAMTDSVAVADTVDFLLSAGDHDAELTGLADNCAVDGDNPLTVTVAKDTTEVVTFAVACTAP